MFCMEILMIISTFTAHSCETKQKVQVVHLHNNPQKGFEKRG